MRPPYAAIPNHGQALKLDKHHIIVAGKVFQVCGNTYRMLHDTRFAPHFEFIGSGETHYGIFGDCGAKLPFDDNKDLNAGLALAVLADALAVGFILFALIEIFRPVSGAHFNPAVSIAMFSSGEMKWEQIVTYIPAQIAGGFTGIIFSHLMFYHKIPTVITLSEVTRYGGNYISELLVHESGSFRTSQLVPMRRMGTRKGSGYFRSPVLGTFILVLAIFFLTQNASKKTSLAIGFLVGGELLATSSTMFANPQVTFARLFTYSAAGINPFDGLVFVIMEIIGAMLAVMIWKAVYR